MRRALGFAVWISLTPAVAFAEPAADAVAARDLPDAGAAWDDSHMRSRYQETPRTRRPRITGESGHGALASGSAETNAAVAEGLEFTTQRQWVQGPLGSSSAQAAPSASDRSSGSGITRGSALRAAARSSRGR
jgi:hypothetical protein